MNERKPGRVLAVNGREMEFKKIEDALKAMWEMLSSQEYSQVQSQVIASMCRDGIAKIEETKT